ncbi:MAG: type IV pilus modification PilV family protein [Caldicoprobacterales bacterium]|jgi:uncharacterized protein YneF (UPF0154 family)|nr:type II secretion system protein [Clostridiales bacterium]
MKNNKGISLIEIIVSILILALIVGPFTGIFIQSRMVRKTMSRQLKAIYAVRNEMEMLMSMNSGEVYGSKGEKSVDDIFIRTQVHPYDAEIGYACFYIILKSKPDEGDEIMVLTPDGCKTFLPDVSSDPCEVHIVINKESYQIRVGSGSVSGTCQFTGNPTIQINLTDKMPDVPYEFKVDGNVDITVYPGNHNNWNLNYGGEYRVVDRCFYRDYSVFRAKIEAFDDPGYSKRIFGIENIFAVVN